MPRLNVNLNKENNFIFGKGKLNSVTRADQVTVEYLLSARKVNQPIVDKVSVECLWLVD